MLLMCYCCCQNRMFVSGTGTDVFHLSSRLLWVLLRSRAPLSDADVDSKPSQTSAVPEAWASSGHNFGALNVFTASLAQARKALDKLVMLSRPKARVL